MPTRADEDGIVINLSARETSGDEKGQEVEMTAMQGTEPGTTDAPQPEKRGKSWMWAMLFLHTIGFGLASILIRASVVVGSRPGGMELDNGTFVAMELVGMLIGHSLYIFKHRRSLSKAQYTRRLVILGLTSGGFSMVGNIGYIVLAAAGAGASLLAPLTSLYVIIPVVFATCTGHCMRLHQAAGVILSILVAVAFGMADLRTDDGAVDTKTILFVLAVIVAWGITTILVQAIGSKQSVDDKIAAYTLNVIGSLATGTIGVASVFRTFDTDWRIEHLIVVCAGVSIAVAQVTFLSLSAHMRDEAGLVAPLASVYIIWPVMVGVAAFGEGMPWLKALATALTPVAVILMSVRDFSLLRASISGKVRANIGAVRRRLSKTASVPPQSELYHGKGALDNVISLEICAHLASVPPAVGAEPAHTAIDVAAVSPAA